MATTNESFQAAYAHHTAGRLHEAAELYRQVLQAEPNHVEALHLLGVVAHQFGQHEQAAQLIGQAIALRGDCAAFHSNLADVYRTLDRFELAEASARRALELDPSSHHACNNLGLAHYAAGRLEPAIAAFREALRLQPADADAHNNLGIALQDLGRLDEAETALRRTLELRPDWAAAHANLAAVLRARGQWDAAIEALRRAIECAPQAVEFHTGLGALYLARRRVDDSLACYREALRLNPRSAVAHSNLAAALAAAGQAEESTRYRDQALAINPQLATALFNLAVDAHARGRVEAAEECYRQALFIEPRHLNALVGLGQLLEHSGRPVDAIKPYTEAIAVDPQFAAAHFYRANVYRKIDRLKDAIAGYLAALAVQPHYPEAYNGLAVTHQMLGYYDQAAAFCRQGLEQAPDKPHFYANLSEALAHLGLHDEALAAARKALELEPASPGTHSNLLYLLNFMPDRDPAEVLAEHLAWARRHAEPLTAAAPPHTNDPQPERRLRVGYVSEHFRDHAVNFFSEPLIAAHDQSQFEVFCYSDVARPDDATRRLQAAAGHWRQVHGCDDARLAELIRADRIDILVDLAGHIAGNRLLVFARKPAPVQVTYLGYQNTTGMSAMDYRLTDAWADPPGETDRWHTERLVRLEDAFFCYRPAAEAPPLAPLPARQRGYVTFGSFNNFKKVTPAAIDAWLEILSRVPGSRLVVLAGRGGSVEQRFSEQAKTRGVDPQRIDIRNKMPRRAYFELIEQADVALDPLGFNGHTTTCDAIWQGIPVVMLAGRTYASRFGGSVLANVGLSDLIADSPARYVELAVGLAGDLERLNKLRHALRQRMARSVLLNFGGFARKVEAAYRDMWRRWCQAQGGRPPDAR